MATVPASQVLTAKEAAREKLPESVSFARRSRAGAAREGLLPLWVGVGLGILHELMAAEVDEVCGPKGRHDLKLTATRWSGERGSVTLGGRRVPWSARGRARPTTREVPLRSYEHSPAARCAHRPHLRADHGRVNCRGYERTTNEPVGADVEAESRATSKSVISRAFVERTPRTALAR